jgi:molybdopterin/thiamine biosynthesis adenylyltransferase
MLSPEQQEWYSRHLLLDGLDQEKLLAAAIRVRGTSPAARWAARYLAASGVGRLIVDEPSWEPE